ncbi:mechanosensitive ion channel family protein [Lysobacter sp. SG-8]|uniref:Small-conductance mechanosensitive channel n=1 Tax=Marilutibacter penaei TaxID=2759900 RepID=A0A7W3U540_9GAMM|nr:mechanosensitive ion channel family protein [Lysobacter penaei]MBB1089136.1 mechanosensitive ion channel family protein [Lysobacter penaei]
MSVPGTRFDLAPVAGRLESEAQSLLAALPLLALSLLVVAAAWWVGGWLSRRPVVDRLARDNPFLRDLTRTTVRWLVLAGGVLVALEIMDATAMVGAMLGTAGVLGVALGFAFKDILENYLAGVLLSLRQPFAPRDHVVIDGNEGIVLSLTSRATILMTLDGNHLRLPNAMVFRGVTLNYTRNPTRRYQFDVGIGVNEDLIRAQQIGLQTMSTLEGVLEDPPPRAFITSLGDSNVQLRFLGWVDQRSHEYAQVKSEAIRQTKLALERAGMDMPEPIYRVQLQEAPHARALPAHPATRSDTAATDERIDTRATRDLDSQLDRETDATGPEGRDLLDPAAPRE